MTCIFSYLSLSPILLEVLFVSEKKKGLPCDVLFTISYSFSSFMVKMVRYVNLIIHFGNISVVLQVHDQYGFLLLNFASCTMATSLLQVLPFYSFFFGGFKKMLKD